MRLWTAMLIVVALVAAQLVVTVPRAHQQTAHAIATAKAVPSHPARTIVLPEGSLNTARRAAGSVAPRVCTPHDRIAAVLPAVVMPARPKSVATIERFATCVAATPRSHEHALRSRGPPAIS